MSTTNTIYIVAHNLGFISFIIIAFILCSIMLLAGWLLGGRSQSRNKQVQFESGIIAIGDTHLRFSVTFYLIAIIFVIFDVETVFLYVWSISIKECGWTGFIEALIFIVMILTSLIYLMRTGAMNYNINKKVSLNDLKK